MPDRTCAVDGCERKVRRKGLCDTHSHRLRTTGQVGPAEIYQQVRGVCAVEGCDSPHFSLTYCRTHYERFKRHGDPMVVIAKTDPRPHCRAEGSGKWIGDNATYHAVHCRLKAARGPADLNFCHCGNRAAEWAYDHLDPNEKTSKFGAYSLDLAHYSAKCLPCHRLMDSPRSPRP